MREFDANSNELKELSKVRLSDIPEAVDLLRVEANQLGMTGQAGSMARFAITTADGIAHTPRGIYNAALHNIQHPSEMFKTIVGSAAIAAALKIALPEAGPVGKIAAGVMGTWFIASSAPAFLEAYKTGQRANTWDEMHQAGEQWGNAAGHLGVNSALGMVGFKIGAGVSGRILASERLDNFADIKQNFWDGAADKTKALLGFDSTIPTASSIGLRPNYVVEGETAKLVDSIKPEPIGAGGDKVTTPIDPALPMQATVMLRSKASALKMDRYITRMSEGRAGILGDEGNAFANKFGARQESLDALRDFATQNKLTIAESDLRSGRVLLTGKSGDFQNAFNVKLESVITIEGTVAGHTGPVSMPKNLAPHVRSVFGLDERAVAEPSYVLQANRGQTIASTDAPPKAIESGKVDTGSKGADLKATEPLSPKPVEPISSVDDFLKPGGYKATEIAKAQNIPLDTGGKGQNGAFISLGGGVDLKDYNRFFPAHNLEQPNPLRIVEVGGVKNHPKGPTSGDTENALDAIQMQSIAPKAKISMIIGPNSDRGFVDVFERGIFPKNGEGQNSVISASWGLAEHKQTPQVVNTLSMAFRQATIRGVQILAGSGDNGARSRSNTFQPEFPASDHNVTGVGGLKMILDEKGKLSTAIAWNEGEASSTGGGVSKIFKLPSWQRDFNVPMNKDTGLPGRGVPDISTNAARATGFPVRVDGADIVIGGTSAGAPLYGGMLLNFNAELASRGLNPITPLNPWMYARAKTNIFNDVTTGHNHGYESGKGWDAVTGLGWVDGRAMLDAMIANQSTRFGKILSFVPPSAVPTDSQAKTQ